MNRNALVQHWSRLAADASERSKQASDDGDAETARSAAACAMMLQVGVTALAGPGAEDARTAAQRELTDELALDQAPGVVELIKDMIADLESVQT